MAKTERTDEERPDTKPGTPSDRHQELVEWTLAHWPGSETKHFRTALKSILYDPDMNERYKAIPDAFRLDHNE